MSSATLVNAVRGAKIIDRQRAHDRYVELLQKGGLEHANELVELSNKLGKSIDQISADAQALARYSEVEKVLQAGISNDVRKSAIKAQADLNAHNSETQQIIAERERRRIELDQIEMDAHHALGGAAGSMEILLSLKQQHPDLFGGRTVPRV